jgi:hypothetical protein
VRRGLLALVPLMTTLAAGCTGSADDRALPPASPPASSSPSVGATAGAPPTTCERPSKQLLSWAGVSVASHPGPITRSALVFAATTSTGRWYVLAVERAYVHDDGTLAQGHSRSLALTNAAGAGTSRPHLIDIGSSLKTGDVAQDWSNVSWDDATLAAGRQAAEAAIGCLDRA